MTDQTEALARMADHVLAHGLAAATLRPLARAAGTSDRMLIYRFGSKEALVAAILDHLAGRLTALLDAAPLPPAGSPGDLALAVLALMRAPAARPYVALWLEVAAGAARDETGHRAAAARIVAHFRTWLADRLPPDPAPPDPAPPDPAPQDLAPAAETATRLLAAIEGALLIEAAAGPGLAPAIDRALARLA